MADNFLELPQSREITDDQFLAAAEKEIRRYGKVIGSSIIAIGKKLIEIKERVGHGRYGQFVRDRLTFGERTAQEYVRSYELLKSAQCADFKSLKIDPSAIRLLARASTPEAVRIEALVRAAGPGGISYTEVLKLIAATKVGTSVNAGCDPETQAAEESPRLAEPLQQCAFPLTETEQDVTSKPSPALALHAEIDKSLHSPENTLFNRAAEARRAIIQCAEALKLTPTNSETEVGTLVRNGAELTRDDLSQIAEAIVQVYLCCGEFIALYQKQTHGTRSTNDADLILVDDAARLISKPEQPRLPFVTLPVHTPTIANSADAAVTPRRACGRSIGSKETHPRKRKDAVLPAAIQQSDETAGTAAAQSRKDGPEIGALPL